MCDKLIRWYDIYEWCGEGVEVYFIGFKSRDKLIIDKRVLKLIMVGKIGRKFNLWVVMLGIILGLEF